MKYREIASFVLIFAVIVSVGLCAEEGDEGGALPTGPLQDTRVVILIAPKDFNDTEYTQTFDALIRIIDEPLTISKRESARFF